MSCCKCEHVCKMTVAEFREQFKPGDFVTGWSTGKIVKLTAIGEERFLYRDSWRTKEYVRAIAAPWVWRKVERPENWPKQKGE